jgi:hypothetical protein
LVKESLERKPGTAMPGVTGSATCPAGGNPSTTAGKQRYRRGGPPLPARGLEINAAAPCRSQDTLNWRPGPGPGGILAAKGWNPRKSLPFALISKAPADIMMMGTPNSVREDVHSF